MSFPSCFVKSHCLHSSIMNHSNTFSFLGTVFTENASEIGRAVVESGELRVEIGTFVLWFSCTYLESTWRQGAELTKPHMSHLLTSMTGLTNNSEVKLSLPLFDLLCCWGGWVTESLRNKWRWSQGLSFGLLVWLWFCVYLFHTSSWDTWKSGSLQFLLLWVWVCAMSWRSFHLAKDIQLNSAY